MRRHSNFFSSLKQVEKRLKSEDEPPPPKSKPPSAPPPPPPPDACSTDSLSSPIYLHSNRPFHSSIFDESSEAAPAFLSPSPPFSSTAHEDPSVEIRRSEKRDGFWEYPVEDSIQQLIELLGLSDFQKGEEIERGGEGLVSGCECEGGFYSKIVGVEGPKCGKEVERLEGWIRYLMSGEERIEPLRLAHLLLGEAAFVSQGVDCGYGGLEFPLTVDEFLQNDPPIR